MEAATLCFTAAPFSQLKSAGAINSVVPTPRSFLPKPQSTLIYRRTLVVAATPETSSVDYSSSTSVFPAEACETVGGEACDAVMYPEVKPPASPAKDSSTSSTTARATEDVDRDYVEYDEPKTVFPGEACDDLGGEFCEPEYQKGVHK